MSEITIALNTIFSWLEKNYPGLKQSLKPGLSYQEIKSYDDMLGDYYLTSKLYDLYQCCNGTLKYPAGEIINKDDTFYVLDDGEYLSHLEYPNNIAGMIDEIEPFSAIYICPLNAHDYFVCKNGINDFALLSPFLYGTDYTISYY